MKLPLLLCLILFAQYAAAQGQTQRPNIILIMADDMGYSDIGCYGSEIPTPNLDTLAAGGLRFSQFYNTSRCCPTRASLLTGLFPHQTGVGHMSEDPGSRKNGRDIHDWGTPGYKGYLNRHCVTIAEVLKTAGYHTYMAGKWHLGYHEKEKWPLQRGFEKYYGILAGASSYLKPQGGRGLSYNNEKLPPPEGDYYTTDAFTDSAVQFLDKREDDTPFFLYLAYNAPHWPLHAKEEDIRLFRNRYAIGWDTVRARRYRKQLQMGLIQKEWGFSARDAGVRPWEQLSAAEKQRGIYRMAVYAAQVKCIDDNIGKLLAFLKGKDLYDNTLIIFLSDNGACAETYDELGSRPDSLINDPDFSGPVSYGMGWANASNTPFRKWKNRAEEGGISAPFIMHWPGGITAKNRIVSTPAHLVDVMPTVLSVTGAAYPATFHGGQSIYPLTGYSLQPAFTGGALQQHPYMYWEHENNAAIRKGNWKAVGALKNNTWTLYDLAKDRAEMHNLAAEHPDLLKALKAQWHQWAEGNFVLPKKEP
ncbi:arylsulfatase [Chitinophaga japonensis]|uniref:Arylsulfatase n=1 Tax=Chitinophaga japonensis TaxID=104662 RepID=A0A562SZY5_CHIJA|nr:arylsulfatase [Chitinophaga japonensis]TWI86802.1 arylsulfatase [Chitinophaga japonensis]